MRAGGRAPIDRASLEVIELPFSARSVDLVGRRKAKWAHFPVAQTPSLFNLALDIVRAGGRAPIDRASLEVIESPSWLPRGKFICGGITEILPAGSSGGCATLE